MAMAGLREEQIEAANSPARRSSLGLPGSSPADQRKQNTRNAVDQIVVPSIADRPGHRPEIAECGPAERGSPEGQEDERRYSEMHARHCRNHVARQARSVLVCVRQRIAEPN